MRLTELTTLLKRPVAFFTQPLALAQVLSSLTGGLTLVIAAAMLQPAEFTTFALLTLFANMALGIGRASVFQPAIIHQRHDSKAFVRARTAALLCLLVAGSSMLSARPLGVPTWTGAAAIGAASLFPTSYDWLRFRAMQNDERWLVALADGVRLVFIPLPLIVAPLTTSAVSLQVFFLATAGVPMILLALTVRRHRVFAPYASYARAAAWQLGDFAVAQFIVAVPLLVLGTRASGGVVSGIRLAQALLGPLALVFAATVNTLIADGATRDAFRSPRALVKEGTRIGRNVTLISLATVLLTVAVVSVSHINLRGVNTADLGFGLLLVGGYIIMSGWGYIQAITLRLLNQQATVTLGRAVMAAVTLTGFAVAYVGGGADASLITGFLIAGLSSMLVFGVLSRGAYRRVLLEPESVPNPQPEPESST